MYKMTATKKEFNSYKDLVDFIRTWQSWLGPGQFDFNGLMGLLGACLDNLRERAADATELDEFLEGFDEFLEPEQLNFLKHLASRIPNTPTEGDDGA